MDARPYIMVVGVCAAGKSTLSSGLRDLGFPANAFALEHSGSPRIWRRRSPDFLIVLDCQLATIKRRRSIRWDEDRYLVQKRVLEDAVSQADLILTTDRFAPEQLIGAVVPVLKARGFRANTVFCNVDKPT